MKVVRPTTVAAVAVLAAVVGRAEELVEQLGVAAEDGCRRSRLRAQLATMPKTRRRTSRVERIVVSIGLARRSHSGGRLGRAGPVRWGAKGVPAPEREYVAAVAELDDDLAAGVVDGAGQGSQREHAGALADRRHAGRRAALRKHDGVALNHEAEAGLDVGDEVLGRRWRPGALPAP